jgi:hypothetical protein
MSVRPVALVLLAAILAACQPDEIVVPMARHEHPAPVQVKDTDGAQIAALRRAIIRFHDAAAAEAAGWNFVIPDLTGRPCFESSSGGMGYHFANTGLIDAVVNPAEPEAIIYEPQKNGKLRLVAVEYLVPIAAWPHADPPELYGQRFPEVAGFGVYGLHVWAWRHNPDGLFAAYNPKVSCAHAVE